MDTIEAKCNCDPLGDIQQSGAVKNSDSIDIFDSNHQTDYLHSPDVIEPQFRTAIDNLAEGFTIISPIRDGSGNIIDFICRYANSALSRIAKIDKDGLTGKRMSDILPDIHERKLFRTCCEVIYCKETRTLSSVLFKDTVGGRNIDGSFDITITNCTCGVVITFHEVTAQRNAVKDLAQERELLENIIDTIPVMIIIYDNSLKNFKLWW
jgi:PAS domain-containing protein